MTSTELNRLFWWRFVKASMCSEPALFQVLGRCKPGILVLQNTGKLFIMLNKVLGGFVFPRTDKFIWIFKIRDDVGFQIRACSSCAGNLNTCPHEKLQSSPSSDRITQSFNKENNTHIYFLVSFSALALMAGISGQ